jgi:hypothetical protein
MRAASVLPSLRLRCMFAGRTHPVFDPARIAMVLARQGALDVILGTSAQAPLAMSCLGSA